MTTSYYNGIGGIKSSQVGVDTLGYNISNINTVGFKQQEVSFSSVFSGMLSTALNSAVSSDVGMISTASSTTMDLSQGALQHTDNVFDFAVEGKGWLAVSDKNGETKYTRTGSFHQDVNGTLVTQTGEKLLVANAKNLTFDGENWRFDSSIPTDNLVNQDVGVSSIDLPDNIIFPAKPSENVKIGGNLPNGNIASNPEPAVYSSDMGVLYNSDAQNMNLQDGQSVVFGFGNNINYSDGLARYDMCIADDVADGRDLNMDFDVNGKNIKLTIPDGSDSKAIIDSIAEVLDSQNISYEKLNNSIQIRDNNKLYIKSNGGDIVNSNSAIEKLTYKKDDNSDSNFTTMQDFIDKLNNLATFSYGDSATVGLDENGKIYIQNNTDLEELQTSLFKTDNSNDMFVQNLANLGSVIRPNTSSTSLEFNRNHEAFSGNIITPNGDSNELKFDFYKTKIEDDANIWEVVITQKDADGNVLSTTSQEMKFDKIGGLISPTTLTINNSGVNTVIDFGGGFNGITAMDKDNVGFSFSEDGLKEGYLVGYDINENGEIIASFSNSKSGVLAQIPLYHFQNEQGLDSLGGNLYTPTSNSGEAFFYDDNEGNYLAGAKIDNYTLETSNVDLAQAMTEIIVMQKAFDANSKSITTSDQMIQKAIDMKR